MDLAEAVRRYIKDDTLEIQFLIDALDQHDKMQEANKEFAKKRASIYEQWRFCERFGYLPE